MLETLANYIDGHFQAALDGQYIESENPYTTKPWSRIPRSGAGDVNAAVTAATLAFRDGPWSKMTQTQRGAILGKIADVVAEHAEELAAIEVRDNGKTYKEMLPQVRKIPDWYRFYGGLADKINGTLPPSDRVGHMNYVRHEPLGVVGMITPWNSPLMLLAWKLAPALAAGNVAVVKPSEFTSASALRFAQLVTEKAGLPPGVLNIVTGLGSEVGAALTSHPGIAKLAFTGGVGSGRAAYVAAAHNLIPATLELGGKSPNLVFPDANLENAVRGVVSGIFASGGQSCVAGSRVLVHRSIHDRFVARAVELTAKIRAGDPMSAETDLGPVATRPQFERIMQCIRMAKEEGAIVACGGEAIADPAGGPALFVAPTIFTGVHNKMRIAQEEVFGPVLVVIPFDTEEEALAMANDCAFGLGAGVWTCDISRAHRLASRIESGTVWINSYKGASQMSPFGGFKHSGIGREGGIDMIHGYLQTKSVWINLTDTVPYAFPL